jgi:hypothetical protein
MGNPLHIVPSRHLTISRDRGKPAARVRAILAAMAVWPFVASPAAADAVADFYRGKTVAFVFKVVLGYDSSPAMGLAMERGEVDGNGSKGSTAHLPDDVEPAPKGARLLHEQARGDAPGRGDVLVHALRNRRREA